jgi:hypothetical protein
MAESNKQVFISKKKNPTPHFIVTIVSQSGTQLIGFLVYSFLYTSFGFSVVAHWLWSDEGWLSSYSQKPLVSHYGYRFLTRILFCVTML